MSWWVVTLKIANRGVDVEDKWWWSGANPSHSSDVWVDEGRAALLEDVEAVARVLRFEAELDRSGTSDLWVIRAEPASEAAAERRRRR